MRLKRMLKRVVWSGLVLLGLIQLVPYGREHTNPTVRKEPAWSSPRVRELAKRACFDCHSNETAWPWYAHVAPMSWLVQHDVDDGRKHLNFSEFDAPQRHADDCAEQVEEGSMPPWFYLPTHPQARLRDAEKQELIAGFRLMFPERQGRGRGRREDD
ncbi:MAG: heme-binding domain-containing protein [Planctomycetota bacterium]